MSVRGTVGLMVCILTILAVFGIAGPVSGSGQPTEEWVARYDGPGNSTDIGRDMAVDSSGNVYVTGESWGAGTGQDYATIAYDPYGNELWVARYNGPGDGDDSVRDMTMAPSGNVYVTGSSVGNFTAHDYATIAYDPYGNELWVARYNGPSNGGDGARAIANDSSGNIYVTGYSNHNDTHVGYTTVAYDSSGNMLWVARYDTRGVGDSQPYAMAIDPSGNIYVTGISLGNGTNWDYATVGYDSNGNELWVARYHGMGYGADGAYAMAVGSSGNIYVTGYSSGSGTDYDYATIAYDPSGNELWVARYNGPGNGADIPEAIAVDSSGNILVTGSSEGNGTSYDLATVAYDSHGSELWVARYDGLGNNADGAKAIAVDSSRNIYVTGGSYGETNWDYVTVAYDSYGNELWVARYDGPRNHEDIAEALALDMAGNVYVSGFSYGNHSRQDIVTMKYSQDWTPVTSLDIDPDTLNLRSRGRWITAYIELWGGDVADIDVSTLMLNGTIPAESWPKAIGDYDEDGTPDLMVKFNRSRVQEYIEGLNISPGGAGTFGYEVTLTVTGSYNDGTTFECSDTIRVLVVERMGAEPSPFSVAEYEGSMKGGLVSDQPQMSFPLSSHFHERQVIVVSDMDCHEILTRRTKHDTLIMRE